MLPVKTDYCSLYSNNAVKSTEMCELMQKHTEIRWQVEVVVHFSTHETIDDLPQTSASSGNKATNAYWGKGQEKAHHRRSKQQKVPDVCA